MKVYLAGKIAKNDWRHSIFNKLWQTDFDSEYTDRRYRTKNNIVQDGFQYIGPHFLRDDHGAFHGPNTHGRGVGTQGSFFDEELKAERDQTVVNKCLKWIEQSDIIFVWLNKEDAYGTIVEIGYAKSLNKPIFLAIDENYINSTFTNDIWFIKTMCNWVIYDKDAKSAWDKFVKTFKDKIKEPFESYIFDAKELRWLRTKASEFGNSLASKYSVEELNNLDRIKLANDFIKDNYLYLRYKNHNLHEQDYFLFDLAKEIDFKIVRGYFKVTTGKDSKDLQNWNIENTGLIYLYEDNYKRENKNKVEKEKFIIKASPKQIDYINHLLTKYKLTLKMSEINSMNSDEASELINILLKKQEIPDKFLQLTMKEHFSYSKTDVLQEVKKAINKSFTHPFHNFLIDYYDGMLNIKYYNEYNERFSIDWINYLIDILSKEENYNKLKLEFKNSK